MYQCVAEAGLAGVPVCFLSRVEYLFGETGEQTLTRVGGVNVLVDTAM